MKIAVLIATTLLTAQAYAATTVYHDYDNPLREINLQNACVTASEVRSIHPQRTCAELVAVETRTGKPEDRGTEWVCKNWIQADFAFSRAFTRPKCDKYLNQNDRELTCVRVIQVADFLPTTIPISVVTSRGDRDDFPGVRKMHTFPQCM